MASRNSNTVFYVYVHRHATDGRIFYVGKGNGARAYTKYGRNKHWHNINNKHGRIVEFVMKNIAESSAFELEKELIAHYGKENLCNYSDGGDGPSGSKHSSETKEKIRKAHLGRTPSENAIKNAAKAREKPVICSNGMRFDSAIKAQSWLRETTNKKASDSAINACCKGTAKSAYGYTWSYEHDPIKPMPETNKKSVICLETGQSFQSIREASRVLNISHDLISRMLSGSRAITRAKGLTFALL